MLGYLSYVDIKKREVPDLPVLALFLYSLFIVKDFKASLIVGGSIFIFQLLLAVITDGGIGGGDIKLFSVIAFLTGSNLYLLTLPMTVLIIGTLIYFLVAKKDLWGLVPFVPYIFVSFLFYFLLITRGHKSY
jgi:leader peptidase (prepilin peptidase)/N-methyltransferase